MRAAHLIHVYEERLEACIAARRVSVEILFGKAKNMRGSWRSLPEKAHKSLCFLSPPGTLLGLRSVGQAN